MPACGQILASFVLVEDHRFSLSIQEVRLAAEVAVKDFTVDVNVLGLRDLQSFGIMPIRKAFI